MEEKSILVRIGELVAREHQLRSAIQAGTISSEDEHEQLRLAEEELDQCWDMLRRRRAARDRGEDPDAVAAQPVTQVESYLQ